MREVKHFFAKAGGFARCFARGGTVPHRTRRGGAGRLRQGGSMAVSTLAADCGLTCGQVLVGLTAFMQVGLAEVSLEPYAVRLLPPVKCSMADSPLIRYLRGLNGNE